MKLQRFAVGLLFVCAFVLQHSEATGQTRAPGSISIRAGGQELVLSPADLAKVARHDLTLPADDARKPARLSGVLLWDLLQLAHVPSPNASGRQRAVTYVKLTGGDGQSAVMAIVEIDPSFSKRTTLVADRRDGKPLDGAEGPWRVFIPDDVRHARWIRGLVAVEVLELR